MHNGSLKKSLFWAIFLANPCNAAILIRVKITRIISGSHLFIGDNNDTSLHISQIDFISSIKDHLWNSLVGLAIGDRELRVYKYDKNDRLDTLISIVFSGFRIIGDVLCLPDRSSITVLLEFCRHLPVSSRFTEACLCRLFIPVH